MEKAQTTEKALVYYLPLATPTGKARVKRRKNNFGEPISALSEVMTDDDYLEWQISYFVGFGAIWDAIRNESAPEQRAEIISRIFGEFKSKEVVESLKQLVMENPLPKKSAFLEKLRAILQHHKEKIVLKPHKDNKEYVANELAEIFKRALKLGVVNENDIQGLLKFNCGSGAVDIEAQYNVKCVYSGQTISDDFKHFRQEYPMFIKEIDRDSFAEIVLKPKQKAVGYQSMIYLCIYLKAAADSSGGSVIGRIAKSGETVRVQLTKEQLIATAKSFIIASADHSWDMKEILKSLI